MDHRLAGSGGQLPAGAPLFIAHHDPASYIPVGFYPIVGPDGQRQVYPQMMVSFANGQFVPAFAPAMSQISSIKDTSDYSDASSVQPDIIATKSKSKRKFKRKWKNPQPDLLKSTSQRAMSPYDTLTRPKSTEPSRIRQEELYANENRDNEQDHSRSMRRGVSLPPMLCDAMAEVGTPLNKAPVPPPRSRRGSTWSLHKGSQQTVNLSGLSDRLEDFKTTIDKLKSDLSDQGFEVKKPSRPPRRSDRFKKKSFDGAATLPRNFKSRHLDQIDEDYDINATAKVPMPGSGCLEVPSVGTELAIPASIDGSPKIPMPGGRKRLFDAEIIITPKGCSGMSRDEDAFQEQTNHNETISMDESHDEEEECQKLHFPIIVTNPESKMTEIHPKVIVTPSLSNRAQTQEVDHGLKLDEEKNGSEEDAHIYEDVDVLIPETVTMATLSINIDQADQLSQDGIVIQCKSETSSKAIQKSVHNDHNDSDTEYEELESDSKPIQVGDEQPKEASQKNSDEVKTEEASQPSKTNDPYSLPNDLLEGIMKLDSTIENLKIGMIKVYEDVYAKPLKTDVEKVCIEGEIHPEPIELAKGQEITEFAKHFLGIQDDFGKFSDVTSQDKTENEENAAVKLVSFENLCTLKRDILSSIYQGLYPNENDLALIRAFIASPISLDKKYSIIQLQDVLNRNKMANIDFDTLVEGLGQLAKIGQQLLLPETQRHTSWNSIQITKEISVIRGICHKAPWEKIQGGTEILESLGYTEYTGFALQYPKNKPPEYFADHIGDLTVELVLATAEMATLVVHSPPTMETLKLLQEGEAFPSYEYDDVSDKDDDVLEMEVKPKDVEIAATEASAPSLSQHRYENFMIIAHQQVQQPGGGTLREQPQFPESDYEEIASPPLATKNEAQETKPVMDDDQVCDLCGCTQAMVRCQLCSGQVFCLACDDMYHRHPKRTSHTRKTLSSEPHIRPPLPPKGDSGQPPVAPPRKTSRKASTPDLAKSQTQINGVGNMSKMSGRPLPPTPSTPFGQVSTTDTSTGATPKLRRSQSTAVNVPPSQPSSNFHRSMSSPHQNGLPNNGDHLLRGSKVSLNTIGTLQQPSRRLSIASPPTTALFDGDAQVKQRIIQQQSLQLPSQNTRNLNNGEPHVQQPLFTKNTLEEVVNEKNALANDSQASKDPFGVHEGNQPYHEEVRFPPPSLQNSRLQRLSKSSSMHDIAFGMTQQDLLRETGYLSTSNGDNADHINQPWMATQSGIVPAMNGMHLGTYNGNSMNFQRSLSSKNLMQDPWNPDPMNMSQHLRQSNSNWSAAPPQIIQPIPPNINPMQMQQQFPWQHPMMSHMNRSLHELNVPNYFPGSSPLSERSPTGSAKRRGHVSKRSPRHGNSRCGSRSSNRRNTKNGFESSGSEDDSEDFFTGESDEDFVSLSSGSNSRRVPRRSWQCEYCTYVNHPGVNICVMCYKTCDVSLVNARSTPLTQGREIHMKPKQSKPITKSSKPSRSRQGSRLNSSDENEEIETVPRGKFRQNIRSITAPSLNRKAFQPLRKQIPSDEDLSDLERDAVDTYYAVRIGKGNPSDKAMNAGKVKAKKSQISLRRSNTLSNVSVGGRDGDSSSDVSGMNVRIPTPKFAPAPSKGILKKATSNPQLNKIESEPNFVHNSGGAMMDNKEFDVVNINKYLRERTAPPETLGNNWHFEKANDWLMRQHSVDSWSGSKGSRMSPPKSDFSKSNFPKGMVRSVSGQSLGDMDEFHDNFPKEDRRTMDISMSGKKNFRSKRFSRNLDKDLQYRRALSVHRDEEMESKLWMEKAKGGARRKISRLEKSESSTSEDQKYSVDGPGGIGSYLSRKEFSSSVAPNHLAAGVGDSGYISHSSGASGQPQHVKSPIESFTMSVDRGYLGKPLVEEKDLANRYRSMDDLTTVTGVNSTVSTNTTVRNKSSELVRILREAEQGGFTPEDLQVALNHCGDDNDPVTWLKENWNNMMDTVVTLATNAGHEAKENTVGTLSKVEAKEALRKHKGNLWAAVTECVEQRQAKYDELCAKGNFDREDIVTALTVNNGNIEAAFQELNKLQLRPFLVRIWGQDEPGVVVSGTELGENLEIKEVEPEPVPDQNNARGTKTTDVVEEALKEEAELHIKEEEVEEDPVKDAIGRQARRLLAEGKVSSYEKGEIVVQLVTMYYEEDEAILAAEQSKELQEAERLLKQDCELCTNVMKLKEIIPMAGCDHRCCMDCAKNYFTITIRDKSIAEATCPFCQEPKGLNDDENEDRAAQYFAKLDVLIKGFVNEDVHELFQRKLRDRTLMKDPNFKWCYKCSSGFIADPRNKKLVCPDCRAMSCAKCLVPWEPAHDGISCEDFATWKEANDPDNQAKALEQHLAEHGIECPSCKFRYTLTRGGCMHFTCSQCKFEFCIGCEKPFKMGVRCGKGPGCAKMGLHAHHPRNCLFYLRDKEPAELQRLLKKEKVEYKTDDPAKPAISKCPVQVQKETKDGMEDTVCGEESFKGYAGYCKIHYVEYLCGLIFRNNIDPVPILDLGELQQVFTRSNHFMPKQRPGEYEFQYKRRLGELIRHEIPLLDG